MGPQATHDVPLVPVCSHTRIVETLTQLGSRGGQLGVSTIVGSAAYNVSAGLKFWVG